MLWSRLSRPLGLIGLAAMAVGIGSLFFGGTVPLAIALIVVGVILAQALFFNLWPKRCAVVMLHSIAGWRPDRPHTFQVWTPPHCFEGYLKYLKRRGYSTVTLEQMHDHLANGAPLPKRPIVLTFDDAYLDNWVYAAPLLEKYGFTGTVFVPTDFIQPSEEVRATVKDVWDGKLTEDELEVFGYMNRGELRALAASGTLDIQSHAKTHTWWPVSEEVVDFHRPDLPAKHLRWMWWNRHVDRKPFWFQQISHDDVPWGAPVYRSKLALSSPRTTPDPGLERATTSFVAERGGKAFFKQSDWRQQLENVVTSYRAEHPPNRDLESPAEFRERLRHELRGARETLESLSGKPVRFMCWPNGGTCDSAFDLLTECGYAAATLPSRFKQPRNYMGTRPDRIGRFGSTSFFRGNTWTIPWVFSFALKLERNRGHAYAEIPIKAIWLYRQFVKPGGPVPTGQAE